MTPEPLYYDDIVRVGKFRMQNCQKIAQDRLEKFKAEQQEKVKLNKVKYQVYDLVLLKIEARNKLEPKWKVHIKLQP